MHSSLFDGSPATKVSRMIDQTVFHLKKHLEVLQSSVGANLLQPASPLLSSSCPEYCNSPQTKSAFLRTKTLKRRFQYKKLKFFCFKVGCNSTGLSTFVRYNRDIVIAVKGNVTK